MNAAITLQTLGALNVSGDGAPNAADACARPKPLALLVYLALAHPRGFHQLDALLALFWPEADAGRAQISLRQSIHVLRRALGDEVISRRGRTLLGVNQELLRCDAIDFEAAIEADDLERALGLYKGELLPAFHVLDAPEFERWLSAERERLRQLATAAARTLVARNEAEGKHRDAARWAGCWLNISPSDDRALRATLKNLAECGEHEAVDRAFEAHVALLAEDGDEPSAEALALVSQLRERAVASAERARSEPVAAVGAPVVVAAPVVDVPARPDVAHTAVTVRRRRHLRLGGIAVAATVLIAAGMVVRPRVELLFGAPATHPDTLVTRIAVLPFTVRGASSVAYLGEGMVDLLSAKLDGADGLSVVDPRTVLAFEHAHTRGTTNPAEAASVARGFAATKFVLGSITEAGGRIGITATLYDSAGRQQVMIEGTAGNEAELLPVVDKLARDLLAAQYTAAPARMERVAASTTNSLPALKAFLEGERAMRAGQLTAAVDAFTRAVREDSTFALAHYRLSTAAQWSTQSALIQRSIDLAVQLAERLPQHERLSLNARNLVKNGAAEDADRQYRTIVAKYPDDVDAWNQLGELLFHTGPWRGHPIASSRAAFEEVLAREPTNVNAMLHLARLATLERRSDDVSALANRALALHPDRDVVLELHALRTAVAGDLGGSQRLVDTLRATAGGDDDAHLMAWRLATYSDSPRAGQAIASVLTDARNSAALQQLGHTLLAHMNAARADWRGVQRELDIVEKTDPQFAAETRANLSLSWPSSLTPAERDRTARVLATASIDTAVNASHLSADPTRQARGAYLLGTLVLAAGDTAAARVQQQQLAALGTRQDAQSELARHLAYELSARVLWRRGDVAGALREVERGWPTGTPRAALPLFQGDGYTQAHERYFRGQLLLALGRDEEALQWFASVTDDQGEALMLSAPVHLARAQIAERHGEAAIASDQYKRAFALWSGSPSDLRADSHTAPKEFDLLRLTRSALP